MANPADRFGPQTIPESTKEGHLFKFTCSGSDEDIRLYTSKYLKKEWNLRRIVLAIGIEGDDNLISLLKGILEACLKGRAFPQVEGVFQDRCPVCFSNCPRFILGTIIHDDRIDLKRLNLIQDLAKGSLGIIGRDQNADFI